MSLNSKLKRGDWITATNTRTPGPKIVGQVAHDMNLIGPAILEVTLGEGPAERVVINVNFWNIVLTNSNLMED